jgi:hypothetical protein
MDWKSYITKIEFSGIMPQDPGLILLTGREKDPMCSIVDVGLTRLPEDDAAMKQRLTPLCKIPRMSTFAIGAIINRAVQAMPPDQAFVNVGVWHGFSFLAGIIDHPEKRCIGIDNFSQFGGPRQQFLTMFEKYKSGCHLFYDLDYRDYFCKHHQGPIGFYIYDGNHSAANQCEGLKAAEPFLADGALILVDDINADGPTEGTIEFTRQSSGKYVLLCEQHTAHNMHPTFWNGIALIQKTG